MGHAGEREGSEQQWGWGDAASPWGCWPALPAHLPLPCHLVACHCTACTPPYCTAAVGHHIDPKERAGVQGLEVGAAEPRRVAANTGPCPCPTQSNPNSRSQHASAHGPNYAARRTAHPPIHPCMQHAKPVTIGNDVWIGGGAIIMPGPSAPWCMQSHVGCLRKGATATLGLRWGLSAPSCIHPPLLRHLGRLSCRRGDWRGVNCWRGCSGDQRCRALHRGGWGVPSLGGRGQTRERP